MSDLKIVIFGITGDLAQKKLIPALFELWKDGDISENISIFGLSHKDREKSELKKIILNSLKAKDISVNEKDVEKFWSKFKFFFGDFKQRKVYSYLKEELMKTSGNIIYYLATHPILYGDVFQNLENEGLNKNSKNWLKIMIEKPIGNNLKSAFDLNKLLAKFYKEEQIFRIDHYLAKDTIQNILAFRFHNEVFESVWNNKKIDHIQITVAESFGAESRNSYYDSVGALKDVGQNHVLQMLAFVTMDRPDFLRQEDIVEKRKSVIKNLIPVPNSLVLGQYDNYSKEVVKTDTFFAFKTELKKGKLSGVPIYVRGGKKLKKTVTEISLVFKSKGVENPNILTFRIQPNEGIVFKMAVKKPGFKMECETGEMQFCYHQLGKLRDAYLRLLMDAIKGEHSYFNMGLEVELEWKFIDALRVNKLRLLPYQAGTWGPKEANEIIEKDGRYWLEPSEDLCRI
ncbi:MAG TPA: glucose-6-phosphate dehydrogenase [Candidatus Methanoperedens sp.]|nr:glucose-6-phosphate dehydrogenase [Candidatus Methanoperedens sp.]